MPTSIKVAAVCPCCGAPIETYRGGRGEGREWRVARYRCGHVFGTAAPVERTASVNLELAGLLLPEPQVAQ